MLDGSPRGGATLDEPPARPGRHAPRRGFALGAVVLLAAVLETGCGEEPAASELAGADGDEQAPSVHDGGEDAGAASDAGVVVDGGTPEPMGGSAARLDARGMYFVTGAHSSTGVSTFQLANILAGGVLTGSDRGLVSLKNIVPEPASDLGAWLGLDRSLYYQLDGQVRRFACDGPCTWTFATPVSSFPAPDAAEDEIVIEDACDGFLLSRTGELFVWCEGALSGEDERAVPLPGGAYPLSIHDQAIVLYRRSDVHFQRVEHRRVLLQHADGHLSVFDLDSSEDQPVSVTWPSQPPLRRKEVRTHAGGFWIVPLTPYDAPATRHSVGIDGSHRVDGTYPPGKFVPQNSYLLTSAELDVAGNLYRLVKYVMGQGAVDAYLDAPAIVRSELGAQGSEVTVDAAFIDAIGGPTMLVHSP